MVCNTPIEACLDKTQTASDGIPMSIYIWLEVLHNRYYVMHALIEKTCVGIKMDRTPEALARTTAVERWKNCSYCPNSAAPGMDSSSF